MEFKDLFLTPVYLLIIYSFAFWLRRKVTNKSTRKFFIPALTVKLIGAIALGLIYQFYYGKPGAPAGDTFNYFYHSTQIYKAFTDSFLAGMKLLMANGEYDPDTARYTTYMFWYRAPTEYAIVRIAGFLSLFSVNTYTVIALFFAIISFSGVWALYLTFLKLYPTLHKEIAIAVFFIPSVFFWGSGLMKDSITLGALGWLFYGFYAGLVEKKSFIKHALIIFLAGYTLYAIKVYILLSFLPPALFWIFIENNRRIKNPLLRALAKPIFIGLGLLGSFVGATTVTEGDEKYDLDKIGERSKITQEYLSGYVSSGSAYNIGTLDGSIGSMVNVAPQAIFVALFRPFLWEISSPIMLLSALEALLLLFLTLRFIYKVGPIKTIKFIASKPILIFCMIFTLVFAFGVGVNSGNFGTLVRYKIPFIPFFLSALYIMQSHLKRPKKLRRLAVVE